MANGRITSGTGSGPVKTYTSRGGKIEVKYLKVDGAIVKIKIGPPGGGEFNPDQAPGNEFSEWVPAPLGRRTLFVEIKRGDEAVKEFTQEIEVVAG